MFFWTETPKTEIWNQLRYLKSQKNVENLLLGETRSERTQIHHDEEEVSERSFEIVSCIQQADEYYTAAETVGLVTQPLLQFYGAHVLVKAVILANTTKRLSDFEYHGLSSKISTAKPEFRRNLGDYKEDESQWEIEKEFAITNGGVFEGLCESINEFVPKRGNVFTFKDVMGRIPDLSELYSRHYNEDSYCGRLPHQAQGSPNLNIQKGTVAGIYEITPLDCGIYKTFGLLFAGLFILSNVVRYKPAFWMRELEGKTSGSASIVEAFCNLTKRRLPNDTLESIWNEDFEYGTPGRMV